MGSKEAKTYAKSQSMFRPKQKPEGSPLHDKSPLVPPGSETVEGLEPRMLLDDRLSEPAEDDACGTTDLLIQGLVNRLPKPDSTWSLDNRAKWLCTAASIFGLVYKASDGEHREISIDLSREQVAGEPRADGNANGPRPTVT